MSSTDRTNDLLFSLLQTCCSSSLAISNLSLERYSGAKSSVPPVAITSGVASSLTLLRAPKYRELKPVRWYKALSLRDNAVSQPESNIESHGLTSTVTRSMVAVTSLVADLLLGRALSFLASRCASSSALSSSISSSVRALTSGSFAAIS